MINEERGPLSSLTQQQPFPPRKKVLQLRQSFFANLFPSSSLCATMAKSYLKGWEERGRREGVPPGKSGLVVVDKGREGSVRLIRLPIHTSLSPALLSERNLEISFRALFCGKSGCGRWYFFGLGAGRCETCRSVASSPSSPFSFLSLRPTDQPLLMRKVLSSPSSVAERGWAREKRRAILGGEGGHVLTLLSEMTVMRFN